MFESLGVLSVALLGSIVAAAFAAPFIYLRRRVQHADRSRLGATGRRTHARVVELWKDQEGVNVTYEFTPTGQAETVRRTQTFEDSVPQGLAVGGVIEVAYESSAPFYSVALEPVALTRELAR